MPELGDQMYCHQQICIPPTFPYLLRQFAKAAIRTQPDDLLKWSTTYFRCLSVNIPPPVKPRLEYPIPRDHHGMTPGWLRALLHQMIGNQTVTFKTLWDRWIGACLQHSNLIQILCLGGFEDNMAVPWLRFIGLCAAHLTDNLTQTMILICEVLTEEPEGGSAMVPVEVFVDLYQFLARIDASIPQTLRNYHFLDKFLELWQEKIAKDAGGKVGEEEAEESPVSLVSSESTMKSEKESRRVDAASVVSCPSITSQDPDNYMQLLMKIRAEGEEEEFEEEALSVKEEETVEPEPKIEEEEQTTPLPDSEKKDEEDTELPEEEAKPAETKTEEKQFSQQLEEDAKVDLLPLVCDDTVSRDTRESSVVGKSSGKEDDLKVEEDEFLLEDLERLKAVQQEIMGESDDELEKFKASILADAGLTPSQMVAPEHFQSKIEEAELSSSETMKSNLSTTTEPSDKDKQIIVEPEYEEVYVDAVPGIGPKVPEGLIQAVCKYMKEVAKIQHSMVMPRNIRHYECPPLEVYRD